MSGKQPTIIDRCKNVKAVFDALSIIKKLAVVLGLLGSLGGVGGLGYFYTDESTPEPVAEALPDMAVEYSSKGHTHDIPPAVDCDPMINRAVEAWARKHDPQGLGH
jgi:hypothetical protein